MTRNARTLAAGAAVLLLLCLAANAAEPLPAVKAAAALGSTPQVSVLEMGGGPKINPNTPPAYGDVLEAMGVMLNFPSDQGAAPLTWDRLRRCNVVFLTSPPSDKGPDGSFRDSEQEMLDRFLADGGGVLYIGQGIAYNPETHDKMNAWLGKYGAKFEWATIDDDAHTYKDPPKVPWQRGQYLWSNNVTAGPLTQGVKTLYFQNGIFWSPSIRPLQVGGDWQVLARTMATAQISAVTRGVAGHYPERIKEQARTEAVPLIAVRQAGKGRIALFGADPGPFWYDLGRPAGAEICSWRGDGKTPADWLPLFKNLMVWLSEPARQAGYPGGLQGRVKFFVNPEYGTRDALDWDRPEVSWPDSEIYRLYGMHAGPFGVDYWRAAAAGQWKPFRFLIGAHTAATGGKGSVADWKAAARAEGFDGVVFREKILEMTPVQWAAFEKECADNTDASFICMPGQEFTDWSDNRFMRFQKHIEYPNKERLTPDGKRVKDQLSFFFDAGWPAHLPLSPKTNPTAYWNYRVYSSWPVAVYQGGKQIEDNRAAWEQLVWRMEYPTPMGVHLLEDPAEVKGTMRDVNFVLMAPNLSDIWENPRYVTGSNATGMHNIAVAYASNGPVIEGFLPLNHYRATLGEREVPGSYRWRVLIRARSQEPIARVELWGDGQCLRRFFPNQRTFLTTVDEEHGRQRGLLLKVIDVKGREAVATSIMVHDKMMVWYWCGDHCNALPYGQGLDAGGNPTGLGLVTHVKGAYAPAGGPGTTFSDAWAYVPWGTDTSLPGIGTWGEVTFVTPQGAVPEGKVNLMSDSRFWYANRDILVTRMSVNSWADREKYPPQEVPAINGWYPYVRTQALEPFEIVSEDLDLHRDAGQPSLQLCRGEIRFKQAITLDDKALVNVRLLSLGWGVGDRGVYTAEGKLAPSTRFSEKLGRGGYVTWTDEWGQASVFSLDEDFAAEINIEASGKSGRPAFGYALGARTFKPGDVLRYGFLLMRWPVGMPPEAELAKQVQQALNLAKADSGVRITALRGKVAGTRVYQDLQAEGGVFAGNLAPAQIGMRVLLRLRGVNPNWTAAVWQKGQALLEPFAPDPEGFAWTSLDPATQSGAFMAGNLVSCERPEVLLRLLQRSGGGWDLVAHNPTERKVSVTIRGAAEGPVPGLSQQASLAAGAEMRWRL